MIGYSFGWKSAVGIALVVFGLWLHWRDRSKSKPEGGLQEAVRDPGTLKQWSRHFQHAASRAAGATRWKEAKIESALRRYLFEMKSESDPGEYARRLSLLKLRDRLHVSIGKILGDESVRVQLQAPVPGAVESFNAPAIPICRLCHIAPNRLPADTIAVLEPFLESEDKRVRESVARQIGAAGSNASVGPLRRILGGSSSGLKNAAIAGLATAVYHDQVDPECAESLFDDVLNRFQSRGIPSDNLENMCSVLLHFNRDRAAEALLQANAGRPPKEAVLRALDNAGVKVPRPVLLDLLRLLESEPTSFNLAYSAQVLFPMLGRHQNPEDLPVLEKYLSYTERVPEINARGLDYYRSLAETVRQGAANGLLAYHDLGGFRDTIRKRRDQGGFDALTVPQRYYAAVFSLNGEVCNGGFSQYFFNSSGAEWHDALSGFGAMEMHERAELLRKACDQFGKDGPANHRVKRNKQLAELAENENRLFDEIDQAYYSSNETFDVHTARYVVRNAEAFR